MHIVFFSGIADNSAVKVFLSSDVGLKVVVNGSANISEFLEPELDKLDGIKTTKVLLSPPNIAFPSQITQPDVIFNEISEPDSHGKVLSYLHSIASKLNCSVINPPQAIHQIRREQLTTLLSGLDSLRIPKTLRVRATSPDQIISLCARHFAGKDVLIRGAGDHGGISTIRIAPGDTPAVLHRLPFDGRDYLLSEFLEYASADGLYRKFRIVLIDGKLFLRHLIISDSWMVHASSRDFMKSNPQYCDEEIKTLTHFLTLLPQKTYDDLRRINRITGAEYLGLDCNIDSNGIVTVFELNANMNILIGNQNTSGFWDKPIGDIKAALKELILTRAQS